MFYFIIVLLILVIFWISVYIFVRTRNAYLRRQAAAAHRRDPEAPIREVGPTPTFRGTAQDVNAYFFGSRHGAPDAERWTREGRGGVSSQFTTGRGVRREDGAHGDGELPSYQESHKMPKPPAAVYDATRTHSTTQRNIGEQGTQPVQADVAPPIYSQSEGPIVPRL